MASFNPLPTMSFTKWFAIMDYAASLGFAITQLGDNIRSLATSKTLGAEERTGLIAIQSSDNGKSITHAIGWDMEVNLRPTQSWGNPMSTMSQILNPYGYGSGSGARLNSPSISYTPTVNMGAMGPTYSEFAYTRGGSNSKHQLVLQSSIMFALGEWFDSVQAQVSTPSVFKSIDRKDGKSNPDYGKLAKPLPLITPFEKAFDHLGLPKKLLKQITDPSKGLLEESNNTGLGGHAKLWKFNAPYIFANQLAKGKGNAATESDRNKMLKYFYNQNKMEANMNNPAKMSEYSGPRPFRYFGYPQSSILLAQKYPDSALSIVTGTVNVPKNIINYTYGNNGSVPQWQTISDPTAILTFTDKAFATPLWMIRSLSQYGNASKVSGSMHVRKIQKGGKKEKVLFPSMVNATTPDYGDMDFWTKGQSSPAEFKSIITAVADDPTPNMATQLGATPTRGAKPAASGKKLKPDPVATLTASKGAKPSKPKRDFSPEGVKVTITDFTQKDVFNMENSWLVLNITPDQVMYNKIMKDWEKSQVGTMKGKKRVTPPTNYIKQYPKTVQLAFKAGTTLLINTNGKTKPEWKEYKWNRGKDVVTVNKDSRFTFIDNDPLKGMTFALVLGGMGGTSSIDVKLTYDAANQPVTTIDEWFKDGATEMKVEVGNAKGSMMLPININTRGQDISPHQLIDTTLAWTWYQRSMDEYPPKELSTDTYPDAWTIFTSEIEIAYFNADSLVSKWPLMFQAVPFDQSTAKEIDITKEYIELELFVENNTDTYTGFDYSLNKFHSEKILFPCDERYLELESITTDPATGKTITKLLKPAGVLKPAGSIAGLWVSDEGDQAKIEFKSGETIIMPDEINRGFSAIEIGNQQKLTGLITEINTKKYPKGTGVADLPNQMRVIRTVKNIPPQALRDMTYEGSAGEKILAGTGGLIYEDVDKIINIILPNPDPDKGLVRFKLVWMGGE